MKDYNDKSREELLAIIDALNTELQEVKETKTSSGWSCLGEKYAAQVLDSLTSMIVILDYDGRIIEMLSREETNHIPNTSADEIINKLLEELIPEEAYVCLHKTMREVISLGLTVVGEHSLQTGGTTHYFEHSISVLDENYLLCVCRDVSIRVKQQQEIAHLNSLLNEVFNNIPVCLFVKDVTDDFRYLYWNEEFADHWGISSRDAIGRNDHELFRDVEMTDRFRAEDLQVLEKGTIEYEEDAVTASGEERTMITIKTVIYPNTSHPYIVGVSWDTTEMRKVEKSLIEAREKAEEADKLKSSFLANMSHEIRTPLNAIVGFSKLALDARDEEEKWGYIDIVDKNSNLLVSLFNDILDLSAIEADSLVLSPRPVILYEICLEQYERHRHTTQTGVELILDDVDQNMWITTDWNRLGQVLSNLLDNAVKFTSSGEIRYGFEEKNGAIQFYVKDTGIGISAAKVATIFQRFGKVNNFVQGTGLGLALSRMLVEKLGGRIWARSKQGQGSSFYFSLPFVQKI